MSGHDRGVVVVNIFYLNIKRLYTLYRNPTKEQNSAVQTYGTVGTHPKVDQAQYGSRARTQLSQESL